MPILDLRSPQDPTKLKPLSHFEVLSIMLLPKDKNGRERMMDGVRKETGNLQARRGAYDEDDSSHIQIRSTSRGGTAGFLMNALIQLNAMGLNPTLHSAIQIAQQELPKEQGGGQRENQKTDEASLELVRSPRKLRDAFASFGSVAHLWGAHMFGRQIVREIAEDRLQSSSDPITEYLEKVGEPFDVVRGLAPISLSKLPAFLGCAEAILSHFKAIDFRGGAKNGAFVRDPWHVIVPKNFAIPTHIDPAPLPYEWLKLITRSKPINN